jgi:Ca-activated chloride channel family protein
VSKLIKIPVENTQNKWETASDNYQFACSVAGFGMLLRESEYKGNASPLLIRKLALSAKNYDDKYKNEYITLIDKYEDIKEENDKVKTEK